ncbi:MAG: hypothetical protein E7057_05460 [Lentisphaerae bacterium]|nr:hypothetical protein [Lentisphaerota bacterium]
MEMLAKYIRMRTARSAATASHPCVERSTEGINQYREQSLFKSVDQAATSERRDNPLSLPNFLFCKRKTQRAFFH